MERKKLAKPRPKIFITITPSSKTSSAEGIKPDPLEWISASC